MVSVYYLLQQMRHNGAREPIYRHDSVEKNFADEITWITWKTEQNLEIWPFFNSRLEMWVWESCRKIDPATCTGVIEHLMPQVLFPRDCSRIRLIEPRVSKSFENNSFLFWRVGFRRKYLLLLSTCILYSYRQETESKFFHITTSTHEFFFESWLRVRVRDHWNTVVKSKMKKKDWTCLL